MKNRFTAAAIGATIFAFVWLFSVFVVIGLKQFSNTGWSGNEPFLCEPLFALIGAIIGAALWPLANPN